MKVHTVITLISGDKPRVAQFATDAGAERFLRKIGDCYLAKCEVGIPDDISIEDYALLLGENLPLGVAIHVFEGELGE